MSSLSHPSEIARETLRLLAQRRLLPTPEHYQALYYEIAGTRPEESTFPEKWLKQLVADLPRGTPGQLRFLRQIEQAYTSRDGNALRKALIDHFNQCEEAKPDWHTLVAALLQQWDARQAGLTLARKRESINHILDASDAESLYPRLQNLVRSWSQAQPARDAEIAGGEAGATAAEESGALPSRFERVASDGEFLSALRGLAGQCLDTALLALLPPGSPLAREAQALAEDLRTARGQPSLDKLRARIKELAYRLHLYADSENEVRKELLELLRLVIDNIGELVANDQWLRGQIEVVRDMLSRPLSTRGLDDAEQKLKDVIYRQGQLKASLAEAQEVLRQMLTGFVGQLSSFANTSLDYHGKLERCMTSIAAAKDIHALSAAVQEVMQETRNIQHIAQRTHDELIATQHEAEAAQSRIAQLEEELSRTSELVRLDHLTGAYNRQGMNDLFVKEIARAERRKTSLCLALLDVDDFKKLNDAYGHAAGDAALIHLVSLMREHLRPNDIIARHGGEEFLVLLPETTIDEAVKAMQRLQRELTRNYFMHKNEKLLITFSAGVTRYQEHDSPETMTDRADHAMYEAKQAGKNRVELA